MFSDSSCIKLISKWYVLFLDLPERDEELSEILSDADIETGFIQNSHP
jgi:hypothetical protein